jgi:hypothetical protein
MCYSTYCSFEIVDFARERRVYEPIPKDKVINGCTTSIYDSCIEMPLTTQMTNPDENPVDKIPQMTFQMTTPDDNTNVNSHRMRTCFVRKPYRQATW